jgi:hypothetical protein
MEKAAEMARRQLEREREAEERARARREAETREASGK